MLLTFGKTLLLYVAAVLAIYISERFNPSAGDAGLKQSILVIGAVALVLLGAILFAFYQAIAQSPKWWAVVALHLVLSGALFVWLSR